MHVTTLSHTLPHNLYGKELECFRYLEVDFTIYETMGTDISPREEECVNLGALRCVYEGMVVFESSPNKVV